MACFSIKNAIIDNIATISNYSRVVVTRPADKKTLRRLCQSKYDESVIARRLLENVYNLA